MSRRAKPKIFAASLPEPIVCALRIHNARLRDVCSLAACAMTYVLLDEQGPTEENVKAFGEQYKRMQKLVAKIEKGR